MIIKEVNEQEKDQYDSVVTHPLQSWEWGEFRQKTGVKVIRIGIYKDKKLMSGFQLTLHPLPYTPFTIGYIPKSGMPTQDVLEKLIEIGKENRCVFIKLEPNIKIANCPELKIGRYTLVQSSHPLFTKYTFQLDLTKSEDELLKQMSQKTRYNVRLAQKKGVVVEEDNSNKAFKEYLRLTFETTKRQGFYAHNETYHRQMWATLRLPPEGQASPIAHLLTAKYEGKILVTWVVFLFNTVLYYPYGASSNEHREVMPSNLMMWEAMRWGKSHGAKRFDLWGALGPNPNPTDAWIGFHRFKEGYNPRHVEFIGSFDLVIEPLAYRFYNLAHKIRWALLSLKS